MDKIIEAIKACSIIIQNSLSHSGINNLHGERETSNSSGDVQKKLDVISNDLMIDYLSKTEECSILLSEENDDLILVDDSKKYIVAFDPLDGSSNIDCNCCVGTIFCVFEDNHSPNMSERILRKGDEIICAGYVLYGPATDFVITVGNGAEHFVLDRTQSKYIYLGNIHIGTKKIYSINESNYENWYPDMKKYVSQYKVKDTKYTHRYIGSMVADVHRTLLYGGMFSYPADVKNTDGKLRILYECFPMAKIVENAGGKAIIGKQSSKRILEITPKNIHDRTPIILGGAIEIDKYSSE
jgi:fructose-1,6-bisphosphatase I